MKNKCFLFLLVVISNHQVIAQSLKVMTYNIRLDVASDGENDWASRKDFFTSQIQFYKPNIFGVQEAKPNQVTDIANALFEYSYIGTGRDGIGKGESSNIFYLKENLILKEENTFWISQTPDTISKGWDAAYNRVCTYGLFKDKNSKRHFWIFNTHLDHIGEQARTQGIQLILSRIDLVNKKNYPVIFMGDLNSEPTTQRIIDLKKEMNDCRDVSREKPFGPYGTFNNFEHNKPVTKLIDYIFVSKSANITVNKYAVLSDSDHLKYPSDHLPVYVELKIK
ncbi:MAG: endonuclease/exonuclease/phosphatase family protein [Saprospiraceae bacterium]|nr:endonuclease/exonuclease/phosphatase family protein [Saprospiraceae bacterium]